MKRIFAILVSVVMCFWENVLLVNATENGQCGDNAYYTLNEEGVLSISGTGELWDFYWYGSPWGGFVGNDNIVKVEVEEGIINIDGLYRCENLISVVLPCSIIEIERTAFWGCSNLKEINIPNSVQVIGGNAFVGCESIEEIYLPKSIREIGEGALNFTFEGTVDVYYDGKRSDWEKFEVSSNPTTMADGLNIVCADEIKYSPSDWAKSDIDKSIELGLIPSELQSDYQTPITRFDFCKLAYALYTKKYKGAVIISANDKFSDISSLSAKEKDIVGTVADLGIVDGYEDGTFRPYKDISRQEAAVMLMRTSKALGMSAPLNMPVTYEDCNNTADWAMEGIEYVYSAGIMNGVDERTDGIFGTRYVTFAPYSTYTREQAMVTFYRLYNQLTTYGDSSSSTDESGNSSTGKMDYSTAYRNYIDAIEEYKETLEDATKNEGLVSDLEEKRISAMKEYWIIAPANNIPDEVWLCLYEFTDGLGELKVTSKDVNWATLKGQLEGSVDIPMSIAGSVASNNVTYSHNGVNVSFSGGLTLGKVGAAITVKWDNSGFRTMTANPDMVLSTYRGFNDQCLELANDVIEDECREVAKIITGYTSVSDFISKRLSYSLNQRAKKAGLGDVNAFLGECYEMYELASFFQGRENPEETIILMQRLSTKDLLADETITNIAVKTAMSNVNKAKKDLIESAYEYVYGE